MKEGRLSAYNLVVRKKNMQVDFTLYEAGRQLKLPMETEIYIAADDPVRLVSAVVERMKKEKIERSYNRKKQNASMRFLFQYGQRNNRLARLARFFRVQIL